ncbi:low temperature requirement protein A [Streptomyces sp. ISL-87]|uniref:low temperature requirement protein A n=1 Tax=unclassified Streptomyces TaxID=2593676 RepID=UPI001BE8F04E|nr:MULTISPECIES: low temperature requirement protein A [unclassified Streptomyces]MBT2455803.1 low temperature requirement protein A [Streptomyces sp. ISL-86]MBT2610058.1 low temperature requirement protein A [Streptomyces sp. ISL-87]
MESLEFAEKKVAWSELFFDLVLVFAITEVSALLHHDHSWGGVGRALIAFVPIYWVWVGTTVHANTHDADRPLTRLGIFAIGLGGLLMALAAPDAFGDRGLLFACGYLGARLVLALLVHPGLRLRPSPVAMSVVVSGPLLVAGAFLDGWARTGLWAVAAAADLASPRLTRRWMVRIPFDSDHLAERFGLFVMIALGESIVAVGAPIASREHLGAGPLVAVATAFALACGLWWVYFHRAADAIRHGLRTATVQADIVRQVLSYGHLSLIASIIAVAVGMAEAVNRPGGQLPLGVAALLYGGCALYLGTYGYTRWHLFRKWSTTRLAAAAAVLALLPVAALLPALGALALLTAVVTGLNLAEPGYLRRRQDVLAAASPVAD